MSGFGKVSPKMSKRPERQSAGKRILRLIAKTYPSEDLRDKTRNVCRAHRVTRRVFQMRRGRAPNRRKDFQYSCLCSPNVRRARVAEMAFRAGRHRRVAPI